MICDNEFINDGDEKSAGDYSFMRGRYIPNWLFIRHRLGGMGVRVDKFRYIDGYAVALKGDQRIFSGWDGVIDCVDGYKVIEGGSLYIIYAIDFILL